MPKISEESLAEVEKALEEYRQDLEQSTLEEDWKIVRYKQARTFVRWIKGEYQPGEITIGELTWHVP